MPFQKNVFQKEEIEEKNVCQMKKSEFFGVKNSNNAEKKDDKIPRNLSKRIKEIIFQTS